MLWKQFEKPNTALVIFITPPNICRHFWKRPDDAFEKIWGNLIGRLEFEISQQCYLIGFDSSTISTTVKWCSPLVVIAHALRTLSHVLVLLQGGCAHELLYIMS